MEIASKPDKAERTVIEISDDSVDLTESKDERIDFPEKGDDSDCCKDVMGADHERESPLAITNDSDQTMENEVERDESVFIHHDVIRFLRGEISYDEYMGGMKKQGESSNTNKDEIKRRTKNRKQQKDIISYSRRRKKNVRGMMHKSESSVKKKSPNRKMKKKNEIGDKIVDDSLSWCGWCGIKYTSAAHMDRHMDLCRGKKMSSVVLAPAQSSGLDERARKRQDSTESSLQDDMSEGELEKSESTEGEKSDSFKENKAIEETATSEPLYCAYVCRICNYIRGPSFFKAYTRAKIILHYRKHVKQNLMLCEDCVWDGSIASDYLDHIMGHHLDEKPLMCLACNFRTGKIVDLRTHMTVHPQVRPWSCPKCPYRSSQKQSLRKHLSIHYGCRVFRCPGCGLTTYLRKDLMDHLSLPHSFKIKCPDCPFVTKNFSSFISHFKKAHTISGDNIFDSDQLNPKIIFKTPSGKVIH